MADPVRAAGVAPPSWPIRPRNVPHQRPPDADQSSGLRDVGWGCSDEHRPANPKFPPNAPSKVPALDHKSERRAIKNTVPAWQLALVRIDNARTGISHPGIAQYSSAVTACSKAVKWQSALRCLMGTSMQSIEKDVMIVSATPTMRRWESAAAMQQQALNLAMEPNAFLCSRVVSVCEQGQHWERTVTLMLASRRVSIQLDIVCYNAAAAVAASSEQWEMSATFLNEARLATMQCDVVSYGAAISGCENGRRWVQGLGLFTEMLLRCIQCDIISSGAMISACEKGKQWTIAVGMLGEMERRALQADEVACNAAVSACEKSQQWGQALALIKRIHMHRGATGTLTMCAGLCALKKGSQWERAWVLARGAFDKSDGYVCRQDLTLLPWTLATLGATDVQRLRTVTAAAVEKFREFAPSELALFVWSLASIGADSQYIFRAAAEQVNRNAQGFSMLELANLAWAYAVQEHDEDVAVTESVFRIVSQQVRHRLANLKTEGLATKVSADLLESLCTLAWSVKFAGIRDDDLLAKIRTVLMAVGEALDRKQQPQDQLHPTPFRNLHGCDDGDEPYVVIDISDRLVVHKPPGWEVDQDGEYDLGANAAALLSAYVRTLPNQRSAVTRDPIHWNGFLHRLDVTCSGLVLVAKTYRGFYDLKFQLNSGRLAREYVVLCHGWVPAVSQEIHVRARVSWIKDSALADAPSMISPQGKPSITRMKVMAHVEDKQFGRAFSLATIRISTGRRHQIRTHLAHVGHPVSGDYKYSGIVATDRQIFLHRCRLGFYDAKGNAVEAVAPLSSSLVDALAATRAKERGSKNALQPWLAGSTPIDWDHQTSLQSARCSTRPASRAGPE